MRSAKPLGLLSRITDDLIKHRENLTLYGTKNGTLYVPPHFEKEDWDRVKMGRIIHGNEVAIAEIISRDTGMDWVRRNIFLFDESRLSGGGGRIVALAAGGLSFSVKTLSKQPPFKATSLTLTPTGRFSTKAKPLHRMCMNIGASARAQGRSAKRFARYIRRDGAEELVDGAYPVQLASAAVRTAANFWDQVEARERADGRVQHRIIMSLPYELDAVGRRAIITEFGGWFDALELPWEAAVHLPDADGDQRNYHAHFLFHDRAAEIVDGDLVWSRTKAAACRDLKLIPMLRKSYCDTVNAAYARAGLDRRWDTRSFDDQADDLEEQMEKTDDMAQRARLRSALFRVPSRPTVHMGPGTTARDRAGLRTRSGDINAAITGQEFVKVQKLLAETLVETVMPQFDARVRSFERAFEEMIEDGEPVPPEPIAQVAALRVSAAEVGRQVARVALAGVDINLAELAQTNSAELITALQLHFLKLKKRGITQAMSLEIVPSSNRHMRDNVAAARAHEERMRGDLQKALEDFGKRDKALVAVLAPHSLKFGGKAVLVRGSQTIRAIIGRAIKRLDKGIAAGLEYLAALDTELPLSRRDLVRGSAALRTLAARKSDVTDAVRAHTPVLGALGTRSDVATRGSVGQLVLLVDQRAQLEGAVADAKAALTAAVKAAEPLTARGKSLIKSPIVLRRVFEDAQGGYPLQGGYALQGVSLVMSGAVHITQRFVGRPGRPGGATGAEARRTFVEGALEMAESSVPVARGAVAALVAGVFDQPALQSNLVQLERLIGAHGVAGLLGDCVASDPVILGEVAEKLGAHAEVLQVLEKKHAGATEALRAAEPALGAKIAALTAGFDSGDLSSDNLLLGLIGQRYDLEAELVRSVETHRDRSAQFAEATRLVERQGKIRAALGAVSARLGDQRIEPEALEARLSSLEAQRQAAKAREFAHSVTLIQSVNALWGQTGVERYRAVLDSAQSYRENAQLLAKAAAGQDFGTNLQVRATFEALGAQCNQNAALLDEVRRISALGDAARACANDPAWLSANVRGKGETQALQLDVRRLQKASELIAVAVATSPRAVALVADRQAAGGKVSAMSLRAKKLARAISR